MGYRVIVSEEARQYKKLLLGYAHIWKRPKLLGRLSVEISAYPPNKRIRDLDNLLKVTLDSLQYAGLFENDSQIDSILIKRKEIVPNGQLFVTLSEI